MKTGNIIVIGNSPLHEGGGGAYAHQLMTNLQAAGHRIRALFPIYPGKAEWRTTFSQRYPQIEVSWYEMPSQSDPFAEIPADELMTQMEAVRAELRPMIVREKADLVYLHKESLIWGVPALACQYGLRCLATLTGNLLAMVSGAVETKRLKEWIQLCGQPDLVTCCAHHMAATLGNAGLNNIEILRCSVDLEAFYPRGRPLDLAEELGVTSNDVVMLHASKLNAIKRPLDLVRAYAKAVQSNERLLFVVVGNGRMRDLMEAEAERVGVGHRLRMVGWIDNAEMAKYYALTDFTVQASSSEGLSIACLESMACGRPSVASDIPGSRELISHGIDGLLFPVGNVDALTEMILAAAEPERCRRMGAAAREKVEREFSSQEFRHRQLELVDRLV